MKKCFFFFVLLFSVISLQAEDQTSIAILLDTSRSVTSKDFEKAKTEIQALIDQTHSPDTVVIYTFGDTLKKMNRSDLSSIQANDSYTLLYDATYDVAKELGKTPGGKKAIVIISDGLDTKSATILEDIVSYSNNEGIALYTVGVGKANRKSLERMSKLTGGKFYDISVPDLSNEIRTTVAEQKLAQAPEAAQPSPVQQASNRTPQQAAQPATVLPPQPEQQATPAEEEGKFPLWAIGLIVGAAIALGVIAFLVVRSTREVRLCPTCGRKLESYQTICLQCSAHETAQSPAPLKPAAKAPTDGTQEIKVSEDGDGELIPLEWLEKKPVTEEMLSRTFVLMETPMLVVEKGKSQGQAYSLNRAFPISIGRSRVNEIRLDDITVSAQHCRIIPENGKHVLYDLGSTNGTFVNDAKVSKAFLKEGDAIKVGETQFLYKIEQFRN